MKSALVFLIVMFVAAFPSRAQISPFSKEGLVLKVERAFRTDNGYHKVIFSLTNTRSTFFGSWAHVQCVFFLDGAPQNTNFDLVYDIAPGQTVYGSVIDLNSDRVDNITCNIRNVAPFIDP